MKPKLLLYFDTNIILSVSCDAGGRTHEADIIYYTVSPNSSQMRISVMTTQAFRR